MPKPTFRSIHLFLGCLAVAAWLLLLQKAVATVGPYGYYSDLVQTNSYLFSWPFLFVGLNAFITSGNRLAQGRERELQIGTFIGLAPEIVLAVLVLVAVSNESYQWLHLPERVLHYLQSPGHFLAAPFGDFSRWAIGLIDPPTSRIARHLAILNVANVIGWSVIILLSRVSVQAFRRLIRKPHNSTLHADSKAAAGPPRR